jgi:hypothetical protein
VARARNIKPGLFKNEILGVADPLYTLLFEGLWLLADRAGRLEDRPLRIKAEVFPYRDGLDVAAMLSWLELSGFIRRYLANGLALIQIVEFVKHQNPHKNEPESEWPGPEEIGTTPENIGSPPADSGFRIPDSGFLIADTPAAAPPAPVPAAPAPSPAAATAPAPTPAPAKRKKAEKVPMPEGFGISPRVREWAARNGYGQIEQHLEAFIRKAAMNGYVYASWDDALMEAIREDWAKLRAKTGQHSFAPTLNRRPTSHHGLADKDYTEGINADGSLI